MVLIGKWVAIARNETKSYESILLNETFSFFISLSKDGYLWEDRTIVDGTSLSIPRAFRRVFPLITSRIPNIFPCSCCMRMWGQDANLLQVLSHVTLVRQIFHCNITHFILSRVLCQRMSLGLLRAAFYYTAIGPICSVLYFVIVHSLKVTIS